MSRSPQSRWRGRVLATVLLPTLVLPLASVADAGESAPRARASRCRLPDRTTDPLIPASRVETVIETELPGGHVAVSPSGRLFLAPFYFTWSPPHTVREVLRDGSGAELKRFPVNPRDEVRVTGPHALRVDGANRLWVLDFGRHRLFANPKLVAYDLDSGKAVHTKRFSKSVAPLGSLLNDMAIDDRRQTIFISDSSSIAGNPAIVVYDIKTRKGRRVLQNHRSVRASCNGVYVNGKKWTQLFGQITVRPAIDGLALDRKNGYLYWAAGNRGELYRAKVDDLLDTGLSRKQLEQKVELYAEITETDGIAIDNDGNVYLTDQEHGAVLQVIPDPQQPGKGKLRTLIKDPRFAWPVSVDLGPDGWLYLTCWNVARTTFKSRSEVKKGGPYRLYRFRPNDS